MKLIVANFKMNLLKEDILEYLNYFDNKYSNVIFCPSNIYLNYFLDKKLLVGSQDVSANEMGAYTGDVSASQLKSMGVKYAIIGHSERRKYHNDDKFIKEKLINTIINDLTPILCIGESKEERDNNKTFEVLKHQLDEALSNIDKNLLQNKDHISRNTAKYLQNLFLLASLRYFATFRLCTSLNMLIPRVDYISKIEL